MIFVTVGTQLAFDRLISTVDDWAGRHPDQQVFAQVGPSGYVPRFIEHAPFISPQECKERMVAADAVVAHAGMGTILSALELGKPVVVMPRKAQLGEHRNDHQLATADRLSALGRVRVATDEQALTAALNALSATEAPDQIGPYASDRLLDAVRRFIAT